MEREQICEAGEGLPPEVHNNNVRFNVILNHCKRPRQVYSMLLSLIEPGIEKGNNVRQKRKVIIGNLLSGLDVTQSNE